jgi:hypothetical protein
MIWPFKVAEVFFTTDAGKFDTVARTTVGVVNDWDGAAQTSPASFVAAAVK